MARFVLPICLGLLLGFAADRPLQAAKPAQDLLPNTTKIYCSFPDMNAARRGWDNCQLGKIANDPIMRPFMDDLKVQVRQKLTDAYGRVGLSLEDVEGVAGGEVCFARIQPDGDIKQHALVISIDVTGKSERAKEVLERITESLVERGARRSNQQMRGVDIRAFTVPPAKRTGRSHFAYLFLHDDMLIACDHARVTGYLIKRLFEPGDDTLSSVASFATCQQRCAEASGLTKPHVRWWADPFGFAHVMRAVEGAGPVSGEPDMLKILEDQGFNAIRGLGGQIQFGHEGTEMTHRTFVHAPTGASGTRFRLASRMLDFPNSEPLLPENWIPADVGSYLSFNWKMQPAFNYSASLVNQIADEEIFEDLLESFRTDGKGPQIDIRQDLVAHVSERATFLTDHRLPIDPQCERLMFAIELTNPDVVATAVNKAMEREPSSKQRIVENQLIWEIVNKNGKDPTRGGTQRRPGFGNRRFQRAKGKEQPVLPNSAVTVLKHSDDRGHLIVASHVDHVVDVLKQLQSKQKLGEANDYQMLSAELTKLGAGTDSFRYFARSDQSYRPTYELIRMGRMPESKTMLGKLLNRLFEHEQGVPRKQEIDGAKLPPFETIQKYLGPSGLYVRTLDDGWYVCGCLLAKPEGAEPQPPLLNSAQIPSHRR